MSGCLPLMIVRPVLHKRLFGMRNSYQARHHLEDNCNPEIPRIFALRRWNATLVLAVRRNGKWENPQKLDGAIVLGILHQFNSGVFDGFGPVTTDRWRRGSSRSNPTGRIA